MADGINVTGKVDVYIQLTNTAGNLKKLGECLDMADVEDRAYWNPVPGDRYGGPQGPPIDIQYLGSICVVRMELSRWDTAVWDLLKKRQVVTTAGTIALTDVGKVMLANYGFRLLLSTTTRPLNFPAVILRDSAQFAMGTKFTSLALSFECHRCQTPVGREGILYDSTITEYTS